MKETGLDPYDIYNYMSCGLVLDFKKGRNTGDLNKLAIMEGNKKASRNICGHIDFECIATACCSYCGPCLFVLIDILVAFLFCVVWCHCLVTL